MAKRKTCSHGYYSGGGPETDRDTSPGDEKAIAKHRKKCKAPDIFWHQGFLGSLSATRVICCAGCRTKLR